MSSTQEVDLWSPFTSDILLEVRTGVMTKMPGLEVTSGIDKSLREGPVHVASLGLELDEHDPTFHGGPDKAIHSCKQFTCFPWVPFLSTSYSFDNHLSRLLVTLSWLEKGVPHGSRSLQTGRFW